jgi:hypothetical protein
MTVVVNPSSVKKTIAAIVMRDGGAVARTIALAKGRDENGDLQTLIGTGFSAVASPDASIGYGWSESSVVVVTSTTCTVTVMGGVPPYTYSWVPDDVTWEATFPTSASTNFRSPALSPGDDVLTDFICTVTDSTAATTDANAVVARARNLA